MHRVSLRLLMLTVSLMVSTRDSMSGQGEAPLAPGSSVNTGPIVPYLFFIAGPNLGVIEDEMARLIETRLVSVGAVPVRLKEDTGTAPSLTLSIWTNQPFRDPSRGVYVLYGFYSEKAALLSKQGSPAVVVRTWSCLNMDLSGTGDTGARMRGALKEALDDFCRRRLAGE